MHHLQGLKVAILVADGFEEIEMVAPRQALEEVGASTYLISPRETVWGWNHMQRSECFKVDILLNKAHAKDFDALLLPGGVFNPDQLRMIPEAVSLVRQMNEFKKPIAAICHGPWLLIDAGAVKGRPITSWPSIKIDLLNAGAFWEDKPTVIDKNLLTSRKPQDIPQFNEAMIHLFTTKGSKYNNP